MAVARMEHPSGVANVFVSCNPQFDSHRKTLSLRLYSLAACHGLNGVALLLLLASAGGTTLALLATPPAPNAVFRLVVDYMQLASLIMTPVTGSLFPVALHGVLSLRLSRITGRSAISTVLESDVLNFDTSALFGGRKRSQDGKGACLAPVPATFSAVFGYGPAVFQCSVD